VSSSIVCHDSASPGFGFWRASFSISLLKICSAMLLFGDALLLCGSIDVTSAPSPITRSAAAGRARVAMTSAAAQSRRAIMRASRKNAG
jgi:hypothetical protein